MGWTLTTYNKAPAIGSPSNLATCMYEIFHGIRQRQALAGIAVVNSAYRGDGTFGTISAATDFKDLPIEHWNPNTESPAPPTPLYSNLTALRDRILGLIDSGKFTQASGKSEALDRAWVSDQIGRDIEDDPVHPLQATYWQGLQDALDLLIYLKVSTAFVLNETNCPDLERSQKLAAFEATLEGAWDGMAGATPTVLSYWDLISPLQRTQWQAVYSGANYSADSTDFQAFAIEIPAQVGALTHACYRGQYHAQRHSLDEIDIQIGDAVATLDLTVFTTPGMSAEDFTTGDFDPGVSDTDPVTVTFDTAITTAIPDDCPFTPITGAGGQGAVFFSVEGLDMYFDLAGELEDQA